MAHVVSLSPPTPVEPALLEPALLEPALTDPALPRPALPDPAIGSPGDKGSAPLQSAKKAGATSNAANHVARVARRLLSVNELLSVI